MLVRRALRNLIMTRSFEQSLRRQLFWWSLTWELVRFAHSWYMWWQRRSARKKKETVVAEMNIMDWVRNSIVESLRGEKS